MVYSTFRAVTSVLQLGGGGGGGASLFCPGVAKVVPNGDFSR